MVWDPPSPGSLLYSIWSLTGGLNPGAFLKAIMSCVAVICWWILLALNQLVFIILLISRRVTHQACLLIAADLVLLTPTSVNLKRPNEKKSLMKELLFKHSNHLITPLLPFSYLPFCSGFLWKWIFNLFSFTQLPCKLK